MIELHDKFVTYVNTCFSNTSLFHKSLKEAFEGFCNKNVSGTSSAELMANFCDNLLKKVSRRRVSRAWLRPTATKSVKGGGPGASKGFHRHFSHDDASPADLTRPVVPSLLVLGWV